MKRNEQEQYTDMIRLMQSDTSVDAPPDSIKFAKNLYRTRQAAPSFFRRVAAVLKVDLAAGLPQLGERSGSVSLVRQILLEAGDNSVDLRITAIRKKFDIRGQILGEGFLTGDVELVGPTTLTTTLDDEGGFRFNAVASGDYSLKLRSNTAEIFVEHLSL